MKLDATDLRYLSSDEFRVLTAVEMGSKNHEVVPVSLISQISGLRSGGVNKCISVLAKRNLVARVQNIKYDGYRLTYGGYDYLAMRTFAKRDTIYSVGNQIGTGKESDIYVVADEEGLVNCLKIHRLGRISFRTIKSKRDYLRKGQSASWMYMSRLAAMKEYAFMKVLHEHGFPVPRPVDQARHCLVMELIDAFPLRQIAHVADPGALYSELMDLIVRLARSGLIHGDFNEFNILIREAKEGETHPVPILIDFPQMVSTEHENAEYYFNRDVECIRTFFKKRFRYESTVYPRFLSTVNENDGKKDFELDVMVAASGFGKKEGEALDRYMRMIEEAEGNEDDDSASEAESDDEEQEDQEEAEQNVQKDEESSTTPPSDGEHSRESDEADEVVHGLQSSLDLGEGPSSPRIVAEKLSAGAGLEEEQEEEEEEEEGEEEGSEEEESEDNHDVQEETRQDRQKRTARERATREITTSRAPRDVQAIVTSSLSKNEKAKERKHHGKKSRTDAGRSKGSKKKSNPIAVMRDAF